MAIFHTHSPWCWNIWSVCCIHVCTFTHFLFHLSLCNSDAKLVTPKPTFSFWFPIPPWGIFSTCWIRCLTRHSALVLPGDCAGCIREERWMMLMLGLKSGLKSNPVVCNWQTALVLDSGTSAPITVMVSLHLDLKARLPQMRKCLQHLDSQVWRLCRMNHQDSTLKLCHHSHCCHLHQWLENSHLCHNLKKFISSVSLERIMITVITLNLILVILFIRISAQLSEEDESTSHKFNFDTTTPHGESLGSLPLEDGTSDIDGNLQHPPHPSNIYRLETQGKDQAPWREWNFNSAWCTSEHKGVEYFQDCTHQSWRAWEMGKLGFYIPWERHTKCS